MKTMDCAREREVATAARASRLEGTLREHVLGCAACQETAAVAGFLSALARQPDQTALPDAADLYRRARIVERLFHEPAPVERAMRRLALAEILGILVSAMAVGTWLIRTGADMAQQLSQTPAALLVRSLASPQAIAITLAVAALAATLPLLLAWPLLRVED